MLEYLQANIYFYGVFLISFPLFNYLRVFFLLLFNIYIFFSTKKNQGELSALKTVQLDMRITLRTHQ